MPSAPRSLRLTLQSTALAVFLFLLPFERIPSYRWHGVTLKLNYFAGLAVLVLFLLPSPAAILRRVRLQTADWLLLALWLAGAFSVWFSPGRARSTILLLLWGFVFLLQFIVSRALTEGAAREKAIRLILWSAVLTALFGIYQFVGDSLGLPLTVTGLRQIYSHTAILHFPRIQSVALEPLYFSNFLLVPIFLLLARYVQSAKARTFVAVLLLLVNIVLGISRGAYLALVVGGALFLGYLIWTLPRRQAAQKVGSFLLVMALAVGISAAGITGLNGKEAGQTAAGHARVDDVNVGSSVPGRLDAYKLAFQIFKEHPLAGGGIGSFGIRTAGSPEQIAENGYGIVNNEYLELLAETGLLGFGLFLAFLIAVAWEAKKAYPKLDQVQRVTLVAMICAVLAILVQYNFFSTLSVTYIWMFIGLLRSFSLTTLQLPE
jgi:O-antigen ligase